MTETTNPRDFAIVSGCSSDYEGPVRARKEHHCEHASAKHDALKVSCGGPIQPGESYVRVRMGSWLEFEPVRIECLIRAGIARATNSPGESA